MVVEYLASDNVTQVILVLWELMSHGEMVLLVTRGLVDWIDWILDFAFISTGFLDWRHTFTCLSFTIFESLA